MNVKNVPANKWVTIGGAAFFFAKLHWKVETSLRCKWRRISIVPYWGTFVGKKSSWLSTGVIQVKSPEETLCVSSFYESDVDNYSF